MSVKTTYDEKMDEFRQALKKAAQISSQLTVDTDMAGYRDITDTHHLKMLDAAYQLARLNREHQW